jgi:hypothetical protein
MSTRRCLNALMLAVLVLLSVRVCTGAVFDHMTYQGILIKDGKRVSGNRTLVFKIYNAQSGGTLKWEETRSNLYIENGIANVVLGEENPMSDDIDGTEEYWLEIWVDGVKLGSRIRLTAVPYSINADRLDGLDASQFLGVNHDFGRFGVSDSLYEGAKPLGSKYLGINAKAADSDKLDGNDASAFYLKTQANDHTQNNIDASKVGGLSGPFLNQSQGDARYYTQTKANDHTQNNIDASKVGGLSGPFLNQSQGDASVVSLKYLDK